MGMGPENVEEFIAEFVSGPLFSRVREKKAGRAPGRAPGTRPKFPREDSVNRTGI